jgi:hypothetical protein
MMVQAFRFPRPFSRSHSRRRDNSVRPRQGKRLRGGSLHIDRWLLGDFVPPIDCWSPMIGKTTLAFLITHRPRSLAVPHCSVAVGSSPGRIESSCHNLSQLFAQRGMLPENIHFRPRRLDAKWQSVMRNGSDSKWSGLHAKQNPNLKYPQNNLKQMINSE